jgi:pyruvate ferredoxin oxidoreductase alpha subunit
MGSITGTARKIVDDLREEGESIGLVKLRSFRPFPTEDLREAVKGAKAIGFVDRNRSPGSSGGGIGRIETANALYALQEKPLLLGFFVGLVGRDVMPSDVRFMAEKVLKAAETGKVEKDTYWVQLKGEEI